MMCLNIPCPKFYLSVMHAWLAHNQHHLPYDSETSPHPFGRFEQGKIALSDFLSTSYPFSWFTENKVEKTGSILHHPRDCDDISSSVCKIFS